MKELTTADVEKLRDELQNILVPSSRIRREALLKQKKITSQEFDNIGSKEQKLLDTANQLTRQVSIQILTDIEEPREQIQTAITNIRAAIEKIEKTNQFLANLAVVFDIFATLASAVGSPTPVAIRGILNKLND